MKKIGTALLYGAFVCVLALVVIGLWQTSRASIADLLWQMAWAMIGF